MLSIKNSEIISDISELSEFKNFIESKKHDINNVLLLEPMFLKQKLKEIRQQIIQESLKYIGQPSMKYRWPDIGVDENWFDCSGFITFILKKFDLAILDIRHSYEYFDTYGVAVHNLYKQPWDLIFFSRKWIIPTHMWILISDNEYIHAPWKDNTYIEVSPIQQESIENISNNRLYESNPIWFKRIAFITTLQQKEKWNLNRFNKIV